MAYAMADRVRVDVERGDLDGATTALAASLPRAHAIGARIIVLLALEGAAGLAAARGDDVLAHPPVGGGRGRPGSVSGFANMPADERLLDARMAEARERLDPETVAAAWAEGQALTRGRGDRGRDDARPGPGGGDGLDRLTRRTAVQV